MDPIKWLDERVREWFGRSLPPSVSYPIGPNEIRRWAQAIHYPEPAPSKFIDEAPASPLELADRHAAGGEAGRRGDDAQVHRFVHRGLSWLVIEWGMNPL